MVKMDINACGRQVLACYAIGLGGGIRSQCHDDRALRESKYEPIYGESGVLIGYFSEWTIANH